MLGHFRRIGAGGGGNMAILTDNASSLGSRSSLETEAIPPRAQHERHPADPPESSQRSALELQVGPGMAHKGTCGSESREAKIRELQESIEAGTYHVPAEQIADKMLRSLLQPEHP
jgi:anti-sigma28 factor (negative regulator of flagellin synthesis)